MNSNPSPFAQMSFETTASFLTTATLSGDIETLKSPSARIALGQVVKGGTGSIEIFSKI
jgi:DNA-directed RNA polymerase I subunit RPA1